MNLDSYQAATTATAIYPDAGQCTNTALTYTVLGLASEAGEVAGKLKKILRDHDGHMTTAAVHDLAAEVGDVLWYAARVAAELDKPLSDLARQNLDKLNARANRGTLTGSGDNR